MSLSTPFIRRPVATSLIAAAFLVFGIAAFINLPVAALPQVDFPTLQVSAALPGASPETMASNVATPLERQFSQIAGVSQMTSSSVNGSTSITLQFDLNRNIDAAAQDVQVAINAASGQLPTNLPAAPTFRKVNPADSPIMIIAMTSDVLPLSVVSDYADNILSQQISRLNGVGLVSVAGAQKPAMRIRIDPRRAAGLNLQLDSIRASLANQTVNAPKGALTGGARTQTVYANDQVMDVRVWDSMIVGYHNGAAVRVKGLGGAVADVENNQLGGWAYAGKANRSATLNDGKAILLIVFKQPGANVIQTVDAIQRALPGLKSNIPPSINVTVTADRTQTIRASVQDVEITLLITVALVTAVIFLFLRDARATFIPFLVIPLSLLATAGAMLALHFTLDNLSLMALTIAVGFVVDDAIVMVEAIWRHIEEGQPPMQAALLGASEINFTILTISISLIAVFTPLMFMGGVIGRLMSEFAITLSAAVVISIVMALTLTPMLCSRFLRPPQHATKGVMKGLEDGFAALERAYARGLDVVLRHKKVTLAVFILTAAAAVVLYATVPTGFFPQQDTGFLSGVAVTSQDASFGKTTQKVEAVAQVLKQDPDITAVTFYAGSNSVNQANFSVSLAPREQRSASADQIITRLRPKMAKLVGVQTFLQASQDINVGARGSRAQYQYTLADSDPDELNTWAPRLVSAMQGLKEIKDVSSDQQTDASAVMLTIDRDEAARFGITPADIDTAVYNLVGQRLVTQYFTQANAYHVVIEAPPGAQGDPAIFSTVFLQSPVTGKAVPLSHFVRVNPDARASLSISHQGQYPAATLSFNLSPGVSLGQATAAVEAARQNIGAPPTLTAAFQGTAQAFQQSLSSEPVLILAALVAVYIILGVLYESYIHPLTILSTLPSAGLGALVALLAAGQDLNVIGIIAIILLIGIVKKNGIMIVDVALKLEREHGWSAEEAVREASHQRLRPILMTTACALLGGVPMILGHGTGSEFRQPLGWAIVGGLSVSQVLTLFSTPVIYIYLDKLRKKTPEAETDPAVAGAN